METVIRIEALVIERGVNAMKGPTAFALHTGLYIVSALRGCASGLESGD